LLAVRGPAPTASETIPIATPNIATQERIGIDFRSGDVLDQIWLEQDAFAAQVHAE
jgi:hypothetical protein